MLLLAHLAAIEAAFQVNRPGNPQQLPLQRSRRELLQLLKRERIHQKIFAIREDARLDAFDYIELLYNPKRRHSHGENMFPVEFEQRYLNKQKTD